MQDSMTEIFSFQLELAEGHCTHASAALLKVLGLNSAEQVCEQLPLTVNSPVGTLVETTEASPLKFLVSINRETYQGQQLCLTLAAESVQQARALGFNSEDLNPLDPLASYWREMDRLEADLELRGSELLHSERMASLGTLAAGVAHEINNPLAFIKSNLMSLEGFLQPMVGTVKSLLELEAKDPDFISALKDKGVEYEAEELGFILDDLDEILQDLRDGSDRIVTIVSGLRQYSHPSKNALVGTDLNDAARVAIELSRNEFKYHATLETAFNQLPAVPANAPEITQVLVNLIVNAAHAIEQSGVIRVGSRVHESNVEIWVEDTGAGIEPEQLSKIFNPFFTTKEVGKGTGLGLAISHRIMAEHGGSIDVHSEPGKGARFTLKFPLSD